MIFKGVEFKLRPLSKLIDSHQDLPRLIPCEGDVDEVFLLVHLDVLSGECVKGIPILVYSVFAQVQHRSSSRGGLVKGVEVTCLDFVCHVYQVPSRSLQDCPSHIWHFLFIDRSIRVD